MHESLVFARRRMLTMLAAAPIALVSMLQRCRFAVPGMPAGSPGMEGPRSDPYDVLPFDRNGATQIYARYR